MRLGTFFSIDLSWPNPVRETPAFKELVAQPGVFMVTTDEEQGGEVIRRALLTNVPWMMTLSKDSRRAHQQPTLAWNWKVQAERVNPYGSAYVHAFAGAYSEFLHAPSTCRCSLCADAKGNPARVDIPDGPPPPRPPPEPE